MALNVTAGYLLYAKGVAEDALNDAFPDESERTRAYRSRLRFLIENYGGVREQLGDECAALVAELPYEGRFGIEDACIALSIVRATLDELQDLLDEDDELRAKARGDHNTTEDDDARIRRDAAEFSRRHNIDGEKLAEYGKSARSLPDEVDDRGTRDSFYDGNAHAIEEGIRDSAKTKKKPKVVEVKILPDDAAKKAEKSPLAPPLDPPTTAAVPPSPTPAMTDGTPAHASVPPPQPRPSETLSITAEDYSQMDPAQAFKAAMTWLGRHISVVVAGSTVHNSFPRISPLTDLHDTFPGHAPAIHTVSEHVAAMRNRFGKLRAPSGGDSDDLAARLRSIDPHDPQSAIDALREALGERRRDEGDWDKPWGEGGWRDS